MYRSIWFRTILTFSTWGENAHPSIESNVDRLQDADAEFDDSHPINNDENENFFEFRSNDDINLSGSEF